MRSTAGSSGSEAALGKPNSKGNRVQPFSWRVHVFEVARRPGRAIVGSPVSPRRVRVYAPYPEAAFAGAGVAPDETCRPVPVRPSESFAGWQRPRRSDTADFYETIGHALLTGGGMSLALNMAARIAKCPMMRGIVGTLSDRVMHGEELHVAMRCFPQVFSPMQLAMVEAAAGTGLDRAGGLLVTLAARLHKDGKVWRKLGSALAYPVSLIGLTLVASIILEIWALPPMVELFRTLGGRLPPLTRCFYQAAHFIRANAIVIFPAVAALVAACVACAPAVRRTRAFQRLAIRAWPIGPVIQSLALVRALSTFILLKQSGAKVRDQFALAAAAAGNCVVGDYFTACYARITVGESFEEAFTAERHRLGDDGVRIAGKMEIGMAGADLTGLINRIVDEIEDRAENQLNLVPGLIRWPLLAFCCATIGTVALAIVLPYPNLIADVAHQQAAAGIIK